MEQRVVIITGANSGIGRAAALKFASEGYHVVMACRSLQRSRGVQEQIIQLSSNQSVDLIELDMSSFASIRAFCTAFTAKYRRLDILIHNAAYLNYGEKEYKLSPEHIELTFATNTFGPLLMSHLLRGLLEQSPDPRILHACTTNIKHFFDPKRTIEFDNLRGEFRGTRPFSMYKRYGDSKMALLLLNFKLAEEYKSRGINVNALQINRVKLSPATINKMSPLWRVLARVQNLTNPQPSGMADHYFHICTSDEFKTVTGRFINHRREIMHPATTETGLAQLRNIFGSESYPAYAADVQNIEKIWALGMTLIGE
ncbi:short-chain dehydrogenase [Bacillus sp. FJAT-27264]|uniref:SDR family NAD(P)-dependent oxidoreductase n=1 Tax=Paenibacillus sp. (strain DSM 101736 / FJAT-27264) TaxID=1850362 RepID=UPI0008080A98|nr:SDR family NAD(P)-dependent oxidoreductase [Bacillus sp. FJAT-27264]OBZ14928.1 short-chain dehydrogenase [Bacillus sp. FJAT-27264]